jgi:acyl-CoA thioesterase I
MERRDLRICFIGDSFVNGTGDENFLGWTGRVCAALLDDSLTLTHYNLGVRRQTSADILQRWEPECSQRLPDFCDGRVVLSCGINDMVLENGRTRVAVEDSVANVRSILQRACARYKTLMAGPAPVGDDDLNTRIAPLADAYEKTASELGVPYINIFPLLVHDQAYLAESRVNDGYHPQSGGYAKIASIALAAMRNWCR